MTNAQVNMQRPLLWCARKAVLYVLQAHLDTQRYYGLLRSSSFEAVAFALYHDALEKAQSGVAPLTALIFDLLTEPGRPALAESLSMLQSILDISSTLLERLAQNTLRGSLQVATSGDSAQHALSQLHDHIFRKAAQSVALLSPSAARGMFKEDKDNSECESVPVTITPDMDDVTSIRLVLEMFQSLTAPHDASINCRAMLCNQGIMEQLITVVYKSQSLARSVQNGITSAVLCTLTALMAGCDSGKDYMMHNIGYQQICTVVLFSRVNGVIPTFVLHQIEAMAFDVISPPRSSSDEEKTSSAVETGIVDELSIPASSSSPKRSFQAKIKNLGALSTLISLLPYGSAQDQTDAYNGMLFQLTGPFALQNCSACGNAEPPILDQVLNFLPRLANDQVRRSAISVLEVLGAHRISVSSLKQLLRSLQSPRGIMPAFRPKLATRLLRAICNMIPKDELPREFFYFDGIASGLHLPAVRKWPSKGYSISLWIQKTPAGGDEKQTLLSFRQPLGRGLELFLDGQNLVLRMPGVSSRAQARRRATMKPTSIARSARDLVKPKSPSLDDTGGDVGLIYHTDVEIGKQWHFVTLTQSSSGFMGTKGAARIYMDGRCLWEANIPYISFGAVQSATSNCIGTNRPWVEENDGVGKRKLQNFCGCMSSFRMFDQTLGESQVLDIFNLGYDYFGVFDPAEDVVQKTWERSTMMGMRSRLMEGSLAKTLISAYNAGVSFQGGFANTAHGRSRQRRDGRDVLRRQSRKVSSASASKASAMATDVVGNSPEELATVAEGTYVVKLHHVRDVLDSLGGIKVLFPIFAQFSLPNEDGNYMADPKLGVEVIELIGAMIKHDTANQHFGRVYGFALIAHLLERVSPEYITPDIVTAIVNLCERVAFSENYVDQVTKHLLTNFRLWVFTPLQTQLFAFNAIAQEVLLKGPSRFRSPDVLGVQRLLTALRLYYWVDGPAPHSSSDNKWATATTQQHPVTGAVIGRRLEGNELLQARNALLGILDLFFLSSGGLKSRK